MKTTRSAHPVHPKIGGIGVQTILAATLGLALAFTFSCSDNINIGDGSGDSGEGTTYTYDIKNITGSSFTMVETEYICQEDGTLISPNGSAIKGLTLLCNLNTLSPF